MRRDGLFTWCVVGLLAGALAGCAPRPDELRRAVAEPTWQERALRAAPVPDERISGRVVQVQRRADRTFAQLSVGEIHGVQRRMQFMVHRDGQYVGRLAIESVAADESVGRMVLVEREPHVGDHVWAGTGW